MSDPSEAGERRVVVVSGRPADDELAAIALALDVDGRRGTGQPAPPPSRWRRAARLEASGHPPIADPGLLAGRRLSGPG